jgi:outer membrane protein OmpA-like peptidoglycan-associated protein
MIRYIALLLSVFCLFSCTKKQTKVILLPQENERTGAVIIESQGSALTLDKPYTFTSATNDKGTLTVESANPEKIKQQYNALFKAELKRPDPIPPKQKPKPSGNFTLYFKSAGTQMTSQSMAGLPQIIKMIRKQAPWEITIIGYTDTVGKAVDNIDLSLERARKVAQALTSEGIGQNQITIKGYGEYGLVIFTPDETPEAQNRRVKVLIH